MSFVWVQLYYKGEGEDEPVLVGEPDKFPTSALEDVADLKKAVKAERQVDLSHCDAAKLVVYPPKSSGDQNKYKSGKKLSEVIDELKNTTPPTAPTPPTSEDHPLIVVAPPPRQQQPAIATEGASFTKKRTGGAADDEPLPLKRKLTEQDQEFFAFFPDGTLETLDETSGSKVLKFSKRIADTENQIIFERPCFVPLAEKVKMLSRRDDNGKRNQSGIIITGTSGIGKTFFGFYFAHQLIKEGEVVAFNYRNKFRFVFAPPVSALRETDESNKRRFLLDLLDEYQGGELTPLEVEGKPNNKDDIGDSPHFWGMADKNHVVWKRVLENHGTWLLVDLHSGDQYEDGRRGCKIVVTSTLRHGNWPLLDSGGDLISKKVYMGPLSLDEAKNIAGAVKAGISPEQIEERFGRVGGSARLLFNTPKQAEDKVNEAFGMPATQMLDPNGENPTLTSALVHIEADENFERTGRKFASQEIANRCIDAVIGNKELGEEIWLEATAGKTGADIAGARGIFAERLWHRAVQQGRKVHLKELTDPHQPDNQTEEMLLKKKFACTRRFAKVDLSDLNLVVGDYCLPTNKQFPAVDAVAVLNEDPWASAEEMAAATATNSQSTHPIGVMFQMAIGDTHKLAQSKTINHIDQAMADKVEGFEKGKSSLYLIYVTQNAASFGPNKLNYTYTAGGESGPGKAYRDRRTMPAYLRRIRQFAMSFKKVGDD